MVWSVVKALALYCHYRLCRWLNQCSADEYFCWVIFPWFGSWGQFRFSFFFWYDHGLALFSMALIFRAVY
jgi:hypothetical protein